VNVSRRILLGALSLVLLGLPGQSGTADPAQALPAGDRPNVVVIVIDTLRADHLPFLGYSRDTAPFLTELASEGAVFEDVRSTSSWTAPSTASLFTSLHPVQHGVLAGLLAARKMQEVDPTVTVNRIPAEIETLPEVFRAAGYRTFGVSDNLNVSATLGFDAGFDDFVTLDYQGAETLGAEVTRRKAAIEAAGPYFLYVHYMDPHVPYHGRKPWYERQDTPDATLLARYDSEIRYADESIRKLFDLFGWKDHAIVLVTSDHGEEFYEHGGTEHGKTLYEEVVRVPLLVHGPGIAPRRIAARASLLDVLPTLRELAGLPASTVDAGVSLAPALRGNAVPEERDLFLHVRRQVYRGGKTKNALVRGAWKYVWTVEETEELYDLATDPGEKTDRRAEQAARAATMKQAIVDFEAGCKRFAPEEVHTSLDEATLERLRALGYVR